MNVLFSVAVLIYVVALMCILWVMAVMGAVTENNNIKAASVVVSFFCIIGVIAAVIALMTM